MEVRDDGVGLSEDALTALQKGIGVSTTRARLQHLFGADFRFEFHRQPPGLAVVVAIPWQTDRVRADRARSHAEQRGSRPVRSDDAHDTARMAQLQHSIESTHGQRHGH